MPKVPADVPDTPEGLGLDWRFGGVERVGEASKSFVTPPNWDGTEGLRFEVHIAPGVVTVGSYDPVRREHTAEREVNQQRQTEVGITVGEIARDYAIAWHSLVLLHLLISGTQPDTGIVRLVEAYAYVARVAREEHRAIPTRRVTEWSRKSRSNMHKVLAELDYTPLFADPTRIPAMATLTYPRCWLRVAPRGKAVKRHVRTLEKRYERAWGEDMPFTWKLEFQNRAPSRRCRCETCHGWDDGRAPHIHLFVSPPHGQSKDGRRYLQWLSETWADIVDHPDPEERRKHVLAGTAVDYAEAAKARDPKRLAAYFAKHGGAAGGKEYQHLVPRAWQHDPENGPGRFWGHPGLKRARHTVEVGMVEYHQIRRTMRRSSRARAYYRQGQRYPHRVEPRTMTRSRNTVDRDTGKIRGHRRVRRRRTYVDQGGALGGYLLVNDGPGYAVALARLRVVDAGSERPPVGMRGSIRDRDQDAVPQPVPAPPWPWSYGLASSGGSSAGKFRIVGEDRAVGMRDLVVPQYEPYVGTDYGVEWPSA